MLYTNGLGETEVLVIQEKRGITAGRKDFWKFAGGLVDSKEDISAAVVREVLEETGVHTNFHSILSFRECHTFPFATTDLYCVCLATLDARYGDTRPVPIPQESEIANARWMPLDEFLGISYYKKGLFGTMLREAAAVALATTAAAAARHTDEGAQGGAVQGLQCAKMESFRGNIDSMYFVKSSL